MSPSWSSAKAPQGSSTGIGPEDSPPLALRWSIVMQRNSFVNASIALITAVGQLLTREFKPPPGVTSASSGTLVRVLEPPVKAGVSQGRLAPGLHVRR